VTVSTEPKFTEIYRNRDLYVPAFDIKIDGESLPNYASKDVIDVRYSDSIDRIDSFEITVNNWDAKRQDFKYTGSTKGTPTESDRLFDPNEIDRSNSGWVTSNHLAVHPQNKVRDCS
jgi:uncharacterized protein